LLLEFILSFGVLLALLGGELRMFRLDVAAEVVAVLVATTSLGVASRTGAFSQLAALVV
jgi:hypothetical protein